MESEGAQAEEAVRQAQATANRLFPVPPFYYKAFTDSAWKAHKANRLEDERASGQAGPSNLYAIRKTVTEEEGQSSVPPWNPFTTSDREDLAGKTGIVFEPPRTDWIIEDGAWESFGQLNPLHVKPMAEHELNLPQFRPTDVELTDRQYLHLLLRSLLHTKLKLVEALTKTLRPVDRFQQDTQDLAREAGLVWTNEGEPYARHMHTLALAMILVTNGLRDAQSRLKMEEMLRAQIERRKTQTTELKAKCAEISRKLKALQDAKSSIQDTTEHKIDAAMKIV